MTNFEFSLGDTSSYLIIQRLMGIAFKPPAEIPKNHENTWILGQNRPKKTFLKDRSPYPSMTTDDPLGPHIGLGSCRGVKMMMFGDPRGPPPGPACPK